MKEDTVFFLTNIQLINVYISWRDLTEATKTSIKLSTKTDLPSAAHAEDSKRALTISGTDASAIA